MSAAPPGAADRIVCARCEVGYRPDRTDGECPVCREVAPGHAGRGAGVDDGLDHRALIVVGMSALQVLFLAVLAALLL